ncbi:hypothetical protein PHYBLDRAFT_62356 [Phycomyces blakesleeanus NRRL 1555(-)]|uniref:Uncharacterized protein n=1 Tax=Phycomyces blakesleeanus (strain ATCC 8743b / DSM 1359 / FGSC 10004 / NBRC 33097 / NRRL 1555) TaxID=763407 RepID=A0A162Y801_PHYB8|nr:hypothetical protein PHYBLDRAFT_62356 [Phycomyces blakesleeanus NRRL 1555(-)]OAD78885.1 hypothetical protein PHYBLDRAFT_62356 [Phycomyces blakesleeanus NRRL 1555(-)]|eukprot:XP_018296925.1 hypothetical protein PHYBLDRAFT_62356 [Phycomyces blakesleeanus NRRL 1555(-)]
MRVFYICVSITFKRGYLNRVFFIGSIFDHMKVYEVDTIRIATLGVIDVVGVLGYCYQFLWGTNPERRFLRYSKLVCAFLVQRNKPAQQMLRRMITSDSLLEKYAPVADGKMNPRVSKRCSPSNM